MRSMKSLIDSIATEAAEVRPPRSETAAKPKRKQSLTAELRAIGRASEPKRAATSERKAQAKALRAVERWAAGKRNQFHAAGQAIADAERGARLMFRAAGVEEVRQELARRAREIDRVCR